MHQPFYASLLSGSSPNMQDVDASRYPKGDIEGDGTSHAQRIVKVGCWHLPAGASISL